MGKRNLSLEERFERLEARLSTTERKLEASERRRCHLEANRANLTRENKRLKQHVEILQEKVRELAARLNQDSSNSSKPPSSDVPWKDRRKQKPTGRKPGGQPGREGKTRKPLPPEQVDRTIPVVPERCAGCRSTLRPEDVAGEPSRHQVIEIPPVVAEVVEYVLHALKCRRCGEITAADLPEGVPNQCAGPRLQAILSLLTARFRVTRREARDLVVALFGEKATVSEGTISNLEQRTSEAIKPAYDEALDAMQNAEFVHCDETGWWQGNDRAWLWAAVTPMLKVFRIDPRRNREALRKLLFAFEGFLITDRFSVYRAHDTKRRQLCWAHLIRNFRGLEELGGKARSLGIAGQKIVSGLGDSDLHEGVALVVRVGGVIVSEALSVREDESSAELWVHTDPSHRRRGYATQTASAWFRSTMERRLIPFYSHERANVASRNLAKALGLRRVYVLSTYA